MLACPECRKLHPNDAQACPDHGPVLVPLDELPEEDPQIEPGTMVGEYRVDHKLGSGTFGDVYAGEQPLIGKHVAIKVLHRKFTGNGGVVSRFVAEARAVNRIRHRNIIDIFSFGLREDKQPYFVMERLEGMTLGDLLERDGRVAPADALPILRGIAEGLDAAHEAGITHRDLKPDNIFLVREKDGGHFPKLLDFGVAKLVSDDLSHKTATGAAIGTPSYMAPEQCRGRPVDHRADIYALGVVIHEMLTGRRLFNADSAMDVLFKHVSEPPPAMSTVLPFLPVELDAPVLAMLAKNPRDRPKSAGVAVAALTDRVEQAGGAAAGAPPDTDPSSFERALVKHEADTIAERHVRRGAGAEAGRTDAGAEDAGAASAVRTMASRGASAASTSTETSGPVVISVGDSMTTDPEASSAQTLLATASPVSGTMVGVPTPAAMRPSTPVETHLRAGKPEATEIDAPPARPEPPPHAPPEARSRAWMLVVGAGAVLAAIALLARGEKAATTTATTGAAESAVVAPPARPLPETVTIRLTVKPADADVILDGVRSGSASELLVLPRADQSRAIRIEREGYEAQALVIIPDHDLDLPPIALRPMHATPTATATATARPNGKSPAIHNDLERPDSPRLK